MRFLILNTDYIEFLRWLYAQYPGLEKRPHEEQMRVRMDSLFGVADFYSSNLRELGHEAWDIHVNNEPMQKTWAREHGIRVDGLMPAKQSLRTILQRARYTAAKTPLRCLKPLLRPMLRVLHSDQSWFYDILARQIKHYKPDVILNQNIGLSSRFLQEAKPHIRLLVGQHAATRLSDTEDFSCYDLIISSFPPTIESFRQKGIPAELHRLGFEPRVLSWLKSNKGSTYDVTFIGNFYSVHSSRQALLETLCDKFEQIRIWGPGIDRLSVNSPIRKCYIGQAWGLEMYHILSNSKIALNHHGDIAPYANNMRLFEATGVGTLLITDWKKNLPEMFEPGKEVVTYRSPEECVEIIQYYLNHDDERKAIARGGQQRTLRDHTYFRRMEELVDIVLKYLN